MKPNLSKLSKLKGKKVSTGIYENITTGDALAAITGVAGWPQGITMRWFWVDNQDAFEVVRQLIGLSRKHKTSKE